MEKVIEAYNLKKYYHRGAETVKALDGVDLEIHKGEMVSIVGPSGSGKTTLLNIISCLDSPTSGTLKLNGVEISGLNESELTDMRRRKIGFIFQHFYLIPGLTVKENILIPAFFSRIKLSDQKIKDILHFVGYTGELNDDPFMLSSGDIQRVAIARAIVNSPSIVIADEPTGRLETKEREPIFSLFKDLSQNGITLVIATHDIELAEKTNRIIFLQDGKIIPKEESLLFT